jgi:hypothetical protein
MIGRRLRVATLCSGGLAVVLTLALPSIANAETKVTANITSNTTWTTEGSPYVLEKQVELVKGVTLTIQPGVKVEFTSAGETFEVEGNLKAEGTSAKPIEFTTSAGVAGKGKRGEYNGVKIWAGESHFSWVKFEYGAKGSGGKYAYSVVEVYGGTVTVEHSFFENNAYSGLGTNKTSRSQNVVVSTSTFANDGGGLSVFSPEHFELTKSHVDKNEETGVFINQGKTESPGAIIEGNEITKNSSTGISLERYCTEPTSSFAHGTKNNIYENGPLHPAKNSEANGSQLYVFGEKVCKELSVDWDNNYWGSETELFTGKRLLSAIILCGKLKPIAEEEAEGVLVYTGERWPERTEIEPGPLSVSDTSTTEIKVCEPKPGEPYYYILTTYHLYNAFKVNTIATEEFTIP